LTKEEARYTAYHSFNGEEYHMLGSADAMLRDIRVGLIACDGIITQSMTSTFWFDSDTTKPDTPFDVSFDYFHIKNEGIAYDRIK
jgi:hypothetical protein